MNNKRVWLDLCSGLGGASQPALDRGLTVIRVDMDRRFKPDVVADVRALPLAPFPVDVLWASPPCQQFSLHGLRCFHPHPPAPDLSIATAIRSINRTWAPRCWFVENVWAARPFLNPIFGPLAARLPGHAIWSNQLVLFPNVAPHKGSANQKAGSGKRWGSFGRITRPAHTRAWFEARGMSYIGTGHNGMAAVEAARIPYEIGETICRLIEALG